MADGEDPMNPTIRTSTGILIILLATVGLLSVTLPYRQPPTSIQLENIRAAESLAPRVQRLLDADPRFEDVKASPYTGQNGAVRLDGFVESDGDLVALMKLVAKEQLPVALAWHVRLRGEEP